MQDIEFIIVDDGSTGTLALSIAVSLSVSYVYACRPCWPAAMHMLIIAIAPSIRFRSFADTSSFLPSAFRDRTDNSWELTRQLADADERIRPLQLSSNVGIVGALNAGIDFSRYFSSVSCCQVIFLVSCCLVLVALLLFVLPTILPPSPRTPLHPSRFALLSVSMCVCSLDQQH